VQGGLVPRIYTKKTQQEKRRRLRRAMTDAEIILWAELKNKSLGVRFLRQYSIGAYVVDFYCPLLKLAIEVDGVTHITEEQAAYDKNRENELENLNVSFLRFTNGQVYSDIENVVGVIKERINQESNGKLQITSGIFRKLV
jgi:very-short-patch-repair endonuclease